MAAMEAGADLELEQTLTDTTRAFDQLMAQLRAKARMAIARAAEGTGGALEVELEAKRVALAAASEALKNTSDTIVQLQRQNEVLETRVQECAGLEQRLRESEERVRTLTRRLEEQATRSRRDGHGEQDRGENKRQRRDSPPPPRSRDEPELATSIDAFRKLLSRSPTAAAPDITAALVRAFEQFSNAPMREKVLRLADALYLVPSQTGLPFMALKLELERRLGHSFFLFITRAPSFVAVVSLRGESKFGSEGVLEAFRASQYHAAFQLQNFRLLSLRREDEAGNGGRRERSPFSSETR